MTCLRDGNRDVKRMPFDNGAEGRDDAPAGLRRCLRGRSGERDRYGRDSRRGI